MAPAGYHDESLAVYKLSEDAVLLLQFTYAEYNICLHKHAT